MQSGIAISKVNLAAKRLLELANTAIVICIDINQIGQNCVCSWKVEKHTQTDRHLNDHHYATHTHIRSWSSSNTHKTARLKCSKERSRNIVQQIGLVCLPAGKKNRKRQQTDARKRMEGESISKINFRFTSENGHSLPSPFLCTSTRRALWLEIA